MANTAQAQKRARQAEAHRERNASMRSALRTYIKRVIKAITAGDEEYRTAVPVNKGRGQQRIALFLEP